ncbi:MAG: protein translocase subunit SecD [Oscillospiraceae bacterium]|nr:protein translocase subunit SecD [Oscillospiraceae bacterium]
MKRIPKPVFFVVALLILVFAASSIFGVSYYVGDNKQTFVKGLGDVRWGIDIRGGVEATFKPAGNYDATDEQLDSAKSIIETRMISEGITDYELYADYNSDRIIVRFPWKDGETEYDPAAAIDEISSTAQLTFRPGKEYANVDMGSDGNYVYKTPTGDTNNILMDGSYVKSAKAGVITGSQSSGSSSKGSEYVVDLTLTDEGAEKFKEITTTYEGQVVSIWMDDIMLSAPTVQAVISDGKAQISGSFTAQEATDLANKINAGALPFQLETISSGSISATLGSNSLTAMAYAGVIALVLISIFMIVMYRLPGVIAVIALLGQVGLSVAAISGYFTVFPSFTMTLPGIAGLILSIGMGVDANVITAERIKEEMLSGRTLDSALDRGTKSSLSAIIDGNMTIVIVSIILLLVFGPSNILSWLFGASTTGTIYSFGYTLLMGVISNFIMGIFFSRIMLKSVAGFKFLRHKWLYGGAKGE